MLWLVGLVLADDAWLTSGGPGGYVWGTTEVPTNIVPKRKDYFLPDSGVVSREAPVDWEVTERGEATERRFVRYMGGVLVDAWVVSTKAMDLEELTAGIKPDWTGTVLGPADDGFRAFGTGESWTFSDRTLFHWRDRLGKVEVLASRAIPPPQYGVQRAEPLVMPSDTGSKAQFSGAFKSLIKKYKAPLASCFDQSRMPVEATIQLVLDGTGLPARIKVDSTQPSFNLDSCIAGSLQFVRGAPNTAGTLEILRFR